MRTENGTGTACRIKVIRTGWTILISIPGIRLPEAFCLGTDFMRSGMMKCHGRQHLILDFEEICMKKNKVLEICVDTHCSLVEALRQVNAQLAKEIKELCYTLNMNYTHVG